MGKSSAVYYALGSLIKEKKLKRQEVIFVEVDAKIHNKENKMISKIIDLILLEYSKETDLTEKEPYSRLVECLGYGKVILFIKNIEVFAKESRQVFLYSLLDSIN